MKNSNLLEQTASANGGCVRRLVSWLVVNPMLTVGIINLAFVFITPKVQTMSAACGWFCVILMAIQPRSGTASANAHWLRRLVRLTR